MSLPAECGAEVLRVMREEAQDLSLDVDVYKACAADAIGGPCRTVVPGGGQLRACLEDLVTHNRTAISSNCSRGITHAAILRASDIRLQLPLHDACAQDAKRFCASVPPGNMQVLVCLGEHKSDVDMSVGCSAKLHAYQERVMSDFRLDSRVLQACPADIMKYCANTSLGSGNVHQCLIASQELLGSATCRQEVHRIAKLATSDVRLNRPIARHCMRHVAADGICGGLAAGKGRVLECLKSHMGSLDAKCAQHVDLLRRAQARDVTYNPSIMTACAEEIKSPQFCGDVQHGGGAVLSCLGRLRMQPRFGKECKTLVMTTMMRHSADIRLMVSLHRSCVDDLGRLCNYSQGDANAVGVHESSIHGWESSYRQDKVAPYLTCLRERQVELEDAACKVTVARLQPLSSTPAIRAPHLLVQRVFPSAGSERWILSNCRSRRTPCSTGHSSSHASKT
jgi:golgi apparatus protein 1